MSKNRGKSEKNKTRSGNSIAVRRVKGQRVWELVHPRCAVERADDIEEVERMIAAGEVEIAVDALRWLLDGCSELLRGHRLLGDLALAAGDVPLARAHFARGYDIGRAALRQAGRSPVLPFDRKPNRDFFLAGKGLATCLVRLDKPEAAAEIAKQLLSYDSTDPLDVAALPGGGGHHGSNT